MTRTGTGQHQRARTSSASSGRRSPSASGSAYFTPSGDYSRVDAHRTTPSGPISFLLYDYARRIGPLNESPGRPGTRVRGHRSICADGSVPADLFVLFPCTWGALARLPNRGKAIPRRPATQHSTLSLCIHISRLNRLTSQLHIYSLRPAVPRTSVHNNAECPAAFSRQTAVSHFAEDPSSLHERTRWTSHAWTSCYLSAPIHISPSSLIAPVVFHHAFTCVLHLFAFCSIP